MVSHVSPATGPIGLKDAYRFFVPLMFMAELMMISHAVIAAFLARMPDPEPVLAAYSISFYFHALLGSPVWACQIVFLSYIKDRASVHQLGRFGLQVMAVVAVPWLLIGLTPLGDWFFGSFFGTSESVARVAKICFLVGLVIPAVAIARSLAYAMLMLERRTLYVTLGTLIRLLGLAALLALLTRWFEGAVVGAVALAGCITIETVVAVAIATPAYRRLAPRNAAPPAYPDLWRFSWPIMLMQVAESSVAFTVNFFLGRLPTAELALAAFGVLDSIMRVLLSPLRNLIHTTQTLLRSRADARVMCLFTVHTALLFGAIMLLFHVPSVRDVVLRGIMGLPPHMVEYVTPALGISALLALCMAAGGLTRGMLIASKQTGAIAVSSAVRISAVMLVGVLGILIGAEDGAMLGMLALIVAFGSEAAVLAVRLRQLDRREPRLFAG